jgi:hypothetical protein
MNYHSIIGGKHHFTQYMYIVFELYQGDSGTISMQRILGIICQSQLPLPHHWLML